MKNNILKTMKKNYMYGIAILLIIGIVVMGVLLYNQRNKYTIATENSYNLAFYELIDYISDVKNYLAKSMISTSAQHSSETLMHVWREANLAQVYLSQLPISTNELSNTAKFLNQVSDYSHSLARNTIQGQRFNTRRIK